MAKNYERLLSKTILREKRRDLFESLAAFDDIDLLEEQN